MFERVCGAGGGGGEEKGSRHTYPIRIPERRPSVFQEEAEGDPDSDGCWVLKRSKVQGKGTVADWMARGGERGSERGEKG